MSELPEINFKKKQEKKGFIPWLRGNLGFGGSASTMGGAAPGAANFGRALLGGAGRLGGAAAGSGAGAAATGGLGALLLGKAGMILAVAVVSAAVGTALYVKNTAPQLSPRQSSANSGASPSESYIPAVMRQKPQSSGLDMFADTNKGIASMDEQPMPENTPAPPTPKAPPMPAMPAAPQLPSGGMPAGVPNLAEMMGGGLSTTMGAGNTKMSAMGGFGNKFSGGGPAGGLKQLGNASGAVGTGFPNSPAFDQRKQALAMQGAKRPVYSRIGATRPKFDDTKGSYGQAKGVRAIQKTYAGRNADASRDTQDKAWEGTASGGAGVTAGGAGGGGGTKASASGSGTGIVTSPSLDNIKKGGIDTTAEEAPLPETPSPSDVSPWKGLPQMAMLLILISSILTMIADKIVKIAHGLPPMIKDPVHQIGTSIGKAAVAVAIAAFSIGATIMTAFGQYILGSIYTTGALVAAIAGGQAQDGGYSGSVNASWMAGIAGMIALLGSMNGAAVIKGTTSIFPAKGASVHAPAGLMGSPARPYALAALPGGRTGLSGRTAKIC